MRYLVWIVLFPIALNARNSEPVGDSAYFRHVINALAHDSLEGRLPGTRGEQMAATFIENEFKRSGCKPYKRKKYFAPFSYVGPDTSLVLSSGNVIAKINSASEYSIVITAHYDHIGHGFHHSNDPANHTVYNGADDNASGVAMMLALAHWCNTNTKILSYDMIFVALSGEEDGLFGSIALLTGHQVDTGKIICNINFDMIGHLDKLRPLLFAEGVNEHPSWNTVLPGDSAHGFVVMRRAVRFRDGSDHCTFLRAGIPAVMFTTGASVYYHRPDDEPQNIHYKGMELVFDYMKTVVAGLNRPGLPSLFGRTFK